MLGYVQSIFSNAWDHVGSIGSVLVEQDKDFDKHQEKNTQEYIGQIPGNKSAKESSTFPRTEKEYSGNKQRK